MNSSIAIGARSKKYDIEKVKKQRAGPDVITRPITDAANVSGSVWHSKTVDVKYLPERFGGKDIF